MSSGLKIHPRAAPRSWGGERLEGCLGERGRAPRLPLQEGFGRDLGKIWETRVAALQTASLWGSLGQARLSTQCRTGLL